MVSSAQELFSLDDFLAMLHGNSGAAQSFLHPLCFGSNLTSPIARYVPMQPSASVILPT